MPPSTTKRPCLCNKFSALRSLGVLIWIGRRPTRVWNGCHYLAKSVSRSIWGSSDWPAKTQLELYHYMSWVAYLAFFYISLRVFNVFNYWPSKWRPGSRFAHFISVDCFPFIKKCLWLYTHRQASSDNLLQNYEGVFESSDYPYLCISLG